MDTWLNISLKLTIEPRHSTHFPLKRPRHFQLNYNQREWLSAYLINDLLLILVHGPLFLSYLSKLLKKDN